MTVAGMLWLVYFSASHSLANTAGVWSVFWIDFPNCEEDVCEEDDAQ